MLTSPHTLLSIVIRSLVVYAALLIGFRVLGKREVGQMTPFDLVLLLLIANAVQNAMTGPDTSLEGGLVAAAALFAADFLIARMIFKHDRFRRSFVGSPRLLIRDGQVLRDQLRRENIPEDTLLAALREHGVADASECSIAMLEVDGSISVLKPEDIHSSSRPHRRFRFLKHP